METKLSKRLDRRSKYPLYQQLSNVFRREILEGVYTFGEALPSIDDLKTQLDMTMEDLTKTFAILHQEKLVDYDAPFYRCRFKAVPTVIFEEVSDFRYIIESRGMVYYIVDQPIVLEDKPDGTWITLNRCYYGDHQCLIHAISHFKKDFFVTLINKTIDDTRTFAAFFQENGIKRFDSIKIIDHIKLPEEIALAMNVSKDIVCSRTRYEVKQDDQLILVSDSYILGFGFRFNFMTQLNKK